MTDLVVLSLEAWDGVWRRNQHLVHGLLRTNPGMRVLFVEPAADPVHAALHHGRPVPGRGLRRAPRLPGVAHDALWLYQPTKLLPRRVDPFLDDRLAVSVEHTAERVGFLDPVLWVNDPSGARVLRRTGWRALYDITDDWLEAQRTPVEHARLVRDEDILMRESVEVVVCSPALEATKGERRPVTLVPNAVDVDAYRRPLPRPSDLPAGPVAVYVGTVHTDRVDIDLCARTARGISDLGRLVLVGPAPLAQADRARLLGAGVLLTGPRDRTTIPAYLQHADVLVVPHVVTPFTDSLDPIKVYEYAAVGRPVVSTPVAGFRDAARTSLAAGEDFVDTVRDALPARTRFPEGADTDLPTWRDRVVQMEQVIARVRGGSPPS